MNKVYQLLQNDKTFSAKRLCTVRIKMCMGEKKTKMNQSKCLTLV